MATLPRPEVHDAPTMMRDLRWSQSEKAVARKAFTLALQREFDLVIRETKQRAARIEQPSDLWELELYLTQRRKEIDQEYDYRYSMLPLVFAVLIQKGRLREEDLRGLADEKLEYIRRFGV